MIMIFVAHASWPFYVCYPRLLPYEISEILWYSVSAKTLIFQYWRINTYFQTNHQFVDYWWFFPSLYRYVHMSMAYVGNGSRGSWQGWYRVYDLWCFDLVFGSFIKYLRLMYYRDLWHSMMYYDLGRCPKHDYEACGYVKNDCVGF